MKTNLLLACDNKEEKALISFLEKNIDSFFNADTFDSAIDRLRDSAVQIVLIDEDFCGFNNGWELARYIRKELQVDLPIIFLSRDQGRAMSYFRSDELMRLCDWVLVLPTIEEHLLGEISHQLAQKLKRSGDNLEN